MISVIMPAYNVEKYIVKSIESVLNQTYRDFELIVVNDGSNDRTREMVVDFQKKDVRIRLLDEENSGVSVARNYGIDEARGDYITFLDADDLWESTFLEKTYRSITKERRLFVYSWAEERYMDGRTRFMGSKSPLQGKLDAFVHTTGELRLPFPTISMLISRKILDTYSIRFFSDIRMSEDTAFIIKLLCVTEAYCVPEVLAYYCRRENSATTKKWQLSDWEGTVVIFEKLQRFVEEYGAEEMNSFRIIRNYRTYRFILDCVKRGYIDAAEGYIERWRLWLEEFVHGSGKLRDRLKCRMILSFGGLGLRLLGKI